MKIDSKDFLKLHLHPPLNIFLAHKLTQQEFCPSLSGRNLCGKETTGNCNRCYKYLRAAASGMDDATNVVGLFIWRLRDQAAQAADQFTLPDRQLSSSGNNPFNEILEELR